MLNARIGKPASNSLTDLRTGTNLARQGHEMADTQPGADISAAGPSTFLIPMEVIV